MLATDHKDAHEDEPVEKGDEKHLLSLMMVWMTIHLVDETDDEVAQLVYCR